MNLRDRATVFKYALAGDDTGGQTGPREDIKTVWCKIVPMSEKRALEAGQVLGNRPYLVYLRYHTIPELNNDMFFEWEDKILTVHSVINSDARNKFFEVITFEAS